MRKFTSLFATLVALTASIAVPAQPGDRSVITTRHMPATADRVLQAFLDEGDLAAWWQTTRSLVDAKAGGLWAVTWDDYGEEKTQHSWSGVIRSLSSDRLVIGPLVMNEPDMPLLGPMSLEIYVEPADNGGCNVTVTHSGYGYGDHWDEMYRLVVDGWDHVLGDMAVWFEAAY